MRTKKQIQKTILRDYMRDAYEEFARLLCEEMRQKNPRSKKSVEQFEKAMATVLDREFGKDPGGLITSD